MPLPRPAHAAVFASLLLVGGGAWLLLGAGPADEELDELLAVQRETLFDTMAIQLELTPTELARVREIFSQSRVLGQGNPLLSVHPLSTRECRERRTLGLWFDADARCGKPNMVLIPNADGSPPQVCIDQYEFPNIPCEYPVVNVTAREAALLCRAVGKRLCDAHEWEGACAGELRAPDLEYAWGHSREVMRAVHNRSVDRVWAHGSQKDHAKCATNSNKTAGCSGGFRNCGSNTYPCGSFAACVSSIGVYDQHGNAAEHMNLPLNPSQLASAGEQLGVTEMKGSWFIFSTFEAHEDHCRWRAPDWHGTAVMHPRSHRNYHLGLRCCAPVPPQPGTSSNRPAD